MLVPRGCGHQKGRVPTSPAVFWGCRYCPAPINDEGLPNQRMVWVENGTLRNFVYDRFWASRQDREPTGFVSGWYLGGGTATLDER